MAQADFTRISTNIAALNTLNSLRSINTKLGKAQLRLATGKRINQAADDPAGLTIALKMNARNGGLKAALGNIGDAKNMLAVAESGLQQISDIMSEMKGKATSAATETLGKEERNAIKVQLESLAQQIDDIVAETTWNGEKLLGDWANNATSITKRLQTGAGVNDVTMWSVGTDHRATQATGLDLATNVTKATTSVTSGYVVGGSFDVTNSGTGVTVPTTGAWLPPLSSGTYELEILEKATDAATGTVAADGGDWGAGATLASEAPAAELASGNYRMHIDTSSAAGKGTYTIYNADTGEQVVQRTTEVDFSAAAASVVDNSGNAVGFTIDDSANTIISEGDDLYFSYVAKGYAKMQLSEVAEDGTTAAQSVDASGSDELGTDSTATVFYVDVGAAANSYDTGLGVEVNLKVIGSIAKGDTSRFEYTEEGVSIRLNSAIAASEFMAKVDSALSTVTNSLNDVGSLVARLDAKEEAVAVAQVNTEAAYNRIVNADMAFEQVEASKYAILQQTAVAMLAQSNMAPQGILSLFR